MYYRYCLDVEVNVVVPSETLSQVTLSLECIISGVDLTR